MSDVTVSCASAKHNVVILGHDVVGRELKLQTDCWLMSSETRFGQLWRMSCIGNAISLPGYQHNCVKVLPIDFNDETMSSTQAIDEPYKEM